jgi:hypothetical protein
VTGTTADIFLEYIQRNIPEGVNMSVYQVSQQLQLFTHINYFEINNHDRQVDRHLFSDCIAGISRETTTGTGTTIERRKEESQGG